ncbi:Protein of unknown function [Ignavigranum ruoffiae]|uniref:D-lyxose ketol-isomerase n=1 Tax=Ignavigranum ruoffiae TaxID=89093 RepID=A0A1H9B6I8_9LACT|nr:D-lyxose/D-mannose family sugar isomerase [Ignavigranum ruoffiae]SEP84321.1 Protein of unknown function [Ignavigranum ruoffiae]
METYKEKVIEQFKSSGMTFTNKELGNIEFADFGLNNIEVEGLNLIVYENNKRYCAKEMVLLSNQTCPEHLHPDRVDMEGKQETFRCRKGKVFLFVDDNDIQGNESCKNINPPAESREYYTVKNCIELNPGEQYTIMPNTKHWFKAGKDGAVISEFSSNSDDASDIFTDPNIKRI